MIRSKGMNSLRQKAFFMLTIFLVMMTAFTVISRAADSVTVAQVDVEKISSKVIEHTVEGEGESGEGNKHGTWYYGGDTVCRSGEAGGRRGASHAAQDGRH